MQQPRGLESSGPHSADGESTHREVQLLPRASEAGQLPTALNSQHLVGVGGGGGPSSGPQRSEVAEQKLLIM